MADKDILGPAADGNFVEFLIKEVRNESESVKQGRPIYTSQHWVKIISPGDNKTVPQFCMDEIRMERYGREYDQWKKRLETGETGIIGTPLAAWPSMDRAMAAGLKDQGIYSVEMLAGVKDGDLHRFGPGIMQWRDRARNYLESAKSNAPVERLTAENAALKEQVAALMQQMGEVNNLLAQKGIAPQTVPAAKPAPAVDVEALVAAAVTKAVAAMSKAPAARGWPKGKARKAAEQKPDEPQQAA